MSMTTEGNLKYETVTCSSAGNSSVITIDSDIWDIEAHLFLDTGTSGYVMSKDRNSTTYETWTPGTLTATNKIVSGSGIGQMYLVQTTTGYSRLSVTGKRELDR